MTANSLHRQVSIHHGVRVTNATLAGLFDVTVGKIDYYDKSLTFHSPDLADPAVAEARDNLDVGSGILSGAVQSGLTVASKVEPDYRDGLENRNHLLLRRKLSPFKAVRVENEMLVSRVLLFLFCLTTIPFATTCLVFAESAAVEQLAFETNPGPNVKPVKLEAKLYLPQSNALFLQW